MSLPGRLLSHIQFLKNPIFDRTTPLKIYICDDKAQDMGVGDFVSFLSDRLWAYSDLDPRPRYNMFWSVILYVLCLL